MVIECLDKSKDFKALPYLGIWVLFAMNLMIYRTNDLEKAL